ncbi:MAG TPA: hypothetical protein VKD67_03360 [Acidimicrobiales bacterium]|nr:hypothetical protein [Acidimicrobiales bacterium]
MEWVAAIGGLIAAGAAAVSAVLAFAAFRQARATEERTRKTEFRARLWPAASQAGRSAHRIVTDANLTNSQREERLAYLAGRAVPEIGVHSPRLAERLQGLVLAVQTRAGQAAEVAALGSFDEEMRRIFGTDSDSTGDMEM